MGWVPVVKKDSLARFDSWHWDFILILFETRLVFLLALYKPNTTGRDEVPRAFVTFN